MTNVPRRSESSHFRNVFSNFRQVRFPVCFVTPHSDSLIGLRRPVSHFFGFVPPTQARGHREAKAREKKQISEILLFVDFQPPRQGVTKRCRLSLLTNSALVYEPQCGGRGRVCGASANEYSCAHHVTWSPNKLSMLLVMEAAWISAAR